MLRALVKAKVKCTLGVQVISYNLAMEMRNHWKHLCGYLSCQESNLCRVRVERSIVIPWRNPWVEKFTLGVVVTKGSLAMIKCGRIKIPQMKVVLEKYKDYLEFRKSSQEGSTRRFWGMIIRQWLLDADPMGDLDIQKKRSTCTCIVNLHRGWLKARLEWQGIKYYKLFQATILWQR